MNIKIIKFKGFWKLNDILNKPNSLFLFGDNDQRFGKGGSSNNS